MRYVDIIGDLKRQYQKQINFYNIKKSLLIRSPTNISLNNKQNISIRVILFIKNRTNVLKKYILKKSINSSQKILLNTSQKLDKTWLQQKNTPFKLDMYQLSNILAKIVSGYNKQIQLITNKWFQLSQNLLNIENNNAEDIKIFMLHVSFQTFVNDRLLTTWDEIMVGLQNKRYK